MVNSARRTTGGAARELVFQLHRPIPVATTARAVAASATARQGLGAALEVLAPGLLSVREPSAVSAAAKSAALANRSAGSFSRAVSTAASTPSGLLRRCAVSPGGSSVSILAMMACALGPVNG